MELVFQFLNHQGNLSGLYNVLSMNCHPIARKKHILCTALWFGRSLLNMMFTPVFEEAKMLSTQGFAWQNPVIYLPSTSACDAAAQKNLMGNLLVIGIFILVRKELGSCVFIHSMSLRLS